MPVFKLEELRWTQLDQFDRDQTLFVLSVSPLEEHGPHLPVGVDLFNAEFFSAEITKRFVEKFPTWNVIQMPSIAMGSFAFDAPGSVIVKPRTIKNLLIEYLSSLAKYRFKYFLISNAHGGPTHIVALEEAARFVSKKYGARVVSFSGHLIWQFLSGKYWPEIREQLKLTDADATALKEDAHAGQWETSMMLKLRPDLVDPSYTQLQPFRARLVQRWEPNYPLKHGEGLGYIGHPAKADLKFAEVSSRFLTEKAFELVEKQLLEEKLPRPSMFYRAFFFRTNFVRVVAFAILVAILCVFAVKFFMK